MKQQFKDFASLQSFAESQHKTIVDLSKKVSNLQDENLHLKKLLESTVPLFGENSISNEELICLKQIEGIKFDSDQRPLTLDETRRLDILVKNLQTIRASSKKSDKNEFSDAKVVDLLELVKD